MALPARIKPHSRCDNMRALLSQIFPTGILSPRVEKSATGCLPPLWRRTTGAIAKLRRAWGHNVRSIPRLGNCPVCGLATKGPPMCSSARGDRTDLPLAAQCRRAKIIERKAWKDEAPFIHDLLDWHPRPLRTGDNSPPRKERTAQ